MNLDHIGDPFSDNKLPLQNPIIEEDDSKEFQFLVEMNDHPSTSMIQQNTYSPYTPHD